MFEQSNHNQPILNYLKRDWYDFELGFKDYNRDFIYVKNY